MISRGFCKVKFPATPTVNAPVLVMRFGSPPAGLVPVCWTKICGSNVAFQAEAKAPDEPRARTPAAAIAARPSFERVAVSVSAAAAPGGTDEDLVFGMQWLPFKGVGYNVQNTICNLQAISSK